MKASSLSPVKQKSGAKIRSLGPVADLESHLPSEWWRNLFNSLYLKTDGDVVENHENTVKDVDLIIKYAKPQKDTRILDLCCGQGRHSLELARRGFKRVTGIDRSRYLIRLARKRAQSENLTVAFHEGDARKFKTNSRMYDCIALMGNSFGYFERQEEDIKVLKCISQSLYEDGVILLDLVDGKWMTEHFEPRSWEWADEKHFVCRERQISDDGCRIITREVITNCDRGVIADQFYAERLYTHKSLSQILNLVGFRDITHHDIVISKSSRDQDLGMMARRMFFTAKAPIKSAKPKKHTKTQVTVLLGDSRMPDKVKVNGHFNPEDIETINKMKLSLAELADYQFDYFSDHKTFLEKFKNDQKNLVFNLCDEGYMNDPFKELHVTAYLDMLNIPYTGSGPACLGLCYNKNLIRCIAESLDIPVPLESYIDNLDNTATMPSTFPALLKPNYGDSSMGITKDAVVYSADQLINYFDKIREQFGQCSILVQEFLSGKEYSVGIIGNTGHNYKILPVLEVDYSQLDPDLPQLLGYESKWIPDSPYWNKINYKPAQLDDETLRMLYDYSNRLFNRLNCCDYARFDYRADADGNIKLLEVNPNPGWCWDGKMNIMAGWAGYSYAKMLKMIIQAAQQRLTNGNGNGKK